MTEFEYVAVLVSLILGLGITHLLAGVGRTIHRRGELRLDAVHTLWTATAFLVLVLNWWVSSSPGVSPAGPSRSSS